MMSVKKEMRTAFGLKVLLLIAVLTLIVPSVLGATGFTKQQALYYTGTTWLYRDVRPAEGNTEDIGIEICGPGATYVAGFYALNVGGTWHSVKVTYKGPPNTGFSHANNNVGGTCYQADGGFMTVSPAHYPGTAPDTFKSGWPGKLYIGYAASDDTDTVIDYLYAGSNAELLGSFNTPRSYSQSTGIATVSGATASLQKNAGSDLKLFSSGIQTDSPLVMGVCTDDEGASCTAGGVYDTSASSFPLDTGIVNPGDQINYTRYIVVNGMGDDFCIGTNLRGKIEDADSTVYYSMDYDFNLSFENPSTYNDKQGGNVDVTSDFDVKVTIYPDADPNDIKYSYTTTVSADVAAGSTSSSNIDIPIKWEAYGLSGDYWIKFDVDLNDDIIGCNGRNHSSTFSFDLKPITLPDIYIDGVKTDTFPAPGVPYNLTMYVKNSDNLTLADANVTIVERNGLSLTFPTQIMNKSTSNTTGVMQGTYVESYVTLKADYGGNLSLTMIPAYNRLYGSSYSDLNLSSIIGDYGIFLEGYQADEEQFKFVVNKTLTSSYPFGINLAGSQDISTKPVVNENVVAQVLDFIYGTYVNFLDVFR